MGRGLPRDEPRPESAGPPRDATEDRRRLVTALAALRASEELVDARGRELNAEIQEIEAIYSVLHQEDAQLIERLREIEETYAARAREIEETHAARAREIDENYAAEAREIDARYNRVIKSLTLLMCGAALWWLVLTSPVGRRALGV